MADFTVFRLTFRSPLRIGERGVGLEVTRPYVPADTLFSALCMAWRDFFSEQDMLNDILHRYTPQSSPGSAPFFLTSAFPYAGSVRFFPKPLAHLPQVTIADDSAKAYKRVRFVSETVFHKLLNAEAVHFDDGSCGNDGQVWLSCSGSTKNQPPDPLSLQSFWDAESNDYIFWRVNIRPRVTLDRVNSASMIWHIGGVHFRENAGLWFAVDFRTTDASFQNKFVSCLRLLGDTGLGSERGGGYGLFQFSHQLESLPSAANANSFLTLTPFCPKDTAELKSLTQGPAAYELITRRGWIGSPKGSTLRRKTIWMFSEGSVFSSSASQPPGTLVDVTPEMWKTGNVAADARHDVFRYGYGFPIGLRR